VTIGGLKEGRHAREKENTGNKARTGKRASIKGSGNIRGKKNDPELPLGPWGNCDWLVVGPYG